MTSEIKFVELIQISYKNEEDEEIKMFLGEPEALEIYEKIHKRFGKDTQIRYGAQEHLNSQLQSHINDIKNIIQMFTEKKEIHENISRNY